jgi:hypothetical protein
MKRTAIVLLGILAVAFAQNYRCDWNVVGIGGGDMSSAAYRCGSTVGQTAVGLTTSSAYQAFIGFWQIDAPVGVQEEAKWPSGPVLKTELRPPAPNPATSHLAIRYALAADAPVTLQVHDLTGRVVRTLVSSSLKRGTYNMTWNRTDDRGRLLGSGVYFVKFRAGPPAGARAGDYRQTEKLVLQR